VWPIAIVFSVLNLSTTIQATQVTSEQARAIAKEAYIYAFAMLESYNTWCNQAVLRDSPTYVGGFNIFRHYARAFTPANRDVVTPNNDTPYSWAWLDLRAEPIVTTSFSSMISLPTTVRTSALERQEMMPEIF
jgi:hypothetical protein